MRAVELRPAFVERESFEEGGFGAHISQEASSEKAGVVEPVDEDTYEDEEFWPPAAADWDTHKRSAWSYYANSWYDNWYEDSWYDDSWYDNSWR